MERTVLLNFVSYNPVGFYSKSNPVYPFPMLTTAGLPELPVAAVGASYDESPETIDINYTYENNKLTKFVFYNNRWERYPYVYHYDYDVNGRLVSLKTYQIGPQGGDVLLVNMALEYYFEDSSVITGGTKEEYTSRGELEQQTGGRIEMLQDPQGRANVYRYLSFDSNSQSWEESRRMVLEYTGEEYKPVSIIVETPLKDNEYQTWCRLDNVEWYEFDGRLLDIAGLFTQGHRMKSAEMTYGNAIAAISVNYLVGDTYELTAEVSNDEDTAQVVIRQENSYLPTNYYRTVNYVSSNENSGTVRRVEWDIYGNLIANWTKSIVDGVETVPDGYQEEVSYAANGLPDTVTYYRVFADSDKRFALLVRYTEWLDTGSVEVIPSSDDNAVFYSVDGLRLNTKPKGLYIEVKDGKSHKVIGK